MASAAKGIPSTKDSGTKVSASTKSSGAKSSPLKKENGAKTSPSTKENGAKASPPAADTEVKASSPTNDVLVENGESQSTTTQPSTNTNIEEKQEQVEEKQLSINSDVKEGSSSAPSEQVKEENNDSKLQEQENKTQKSRSVNFAIDSQNDTDVPKLRPSNSLETKSSYLSSKPSRGKIDFIDTLVESYKLETSSNTEPTREEIKYVPKTSRSRINPNWREHRTRRLMNKLEELSLWDREEELKAAQAQALREQKWEQILDRQRNHDLCLALMRQRHESEMESAVKLDPAITGINDENTSTTIANTVKLASTINGLSYDSPLTPQSLKRRVRQDEEKELEFKTPLGRYRQFEKNMTNKLDKINQKLKPDREIMHAYNPNNLSVSASSVPLFSETYSALLSVPDSHPTNKYDQYRFGVASYLHQSRHATSPDFETRLRSSAYRDVRVPLKEQADDLKDYGDDNRDEYSGHYTKYRSTPIDSDYYNRKYRSNSTDDGYLSKYRSTRADEDYNSKYNSAPIDEEYTLKYRSSPLDEEFSSKYRPKLTDDDYNLKYRSKFLDDDYDPKHRSKLIDDDFNLKYRSKYLDDDYEPKRRSKPTDDEYNLKYRSKVLDENGEEDDYYSKTQTKPIDDNYYTRYRSTLASKLDYSPPRRTTSLVSPTASALYDCSTVTNTPREFSLIHARQPTSSSIHQRSLNDDLNAITRFSTETSKKILQNIGESATDYATKSRSPVLPKKLNNVNEHGFSDEDFDFNSSRNYSSKTMHQPPEIISLSSTR